MADKPSPTSQSSDMKSGATDPGSVVSPPRVSAAGQAFRSADVRDAMAVMAERAQLISQDAGSKIAAAMKDVIGAAAGIAGFAIESARDLVQYMVRRGQMSQDEADRLIRQAEEAQGKRPPGERGRVSPKVPADRATSAKVTATVRDLPTRESAPPLREVATRADHAPAPPAHKSKSVPTMKTVAAKKQAAPSAAAKPAKRAAAKPAKKAPKKSGSKKRR
jgi:hypothetical protein